MRGQRPRAAACLPRNGGRYFCWCCRGMSACARLTQAAARADVQVVTAAHGPRVPSAPADRQRWHGRDLQGARHLPRPLGRGEIRPHLAHGARCAPALPGRGPRRRAHPAPQRDLGVSRGRGRRPPVHRHGARPRHQPRPGHEAPALAARVQAGHRDRARPGRRPPRGRPAPRHQAEQCHPRVRRRPGQAARLRPGGDRRDRGAQRRSGRAWAGRPRRRRDVVDGAHHAAGAGAPRDSGRGHRERGQRRGCPTRHRTGAAGRARARGRRVPPERQPRVPGPAAGPSRRARRCPLGHAALPGARAVAGRRSEPAHRYLRLRGPALRAVRRGAAARRGRYHRAVRARERACSPAGRGGSRHRPALGRAGRPLSGAGSGSALRLGRRAV